MRVLLGLLLVAGCTSDPGRATDFEGAWRLQHGSTITTTCTDGEHVADVATFAFRMLPEASADLSMTTIESNGSGGSGAWRDESCPRIMFDVHGDVASALVDQSCRYTAQPPRQPSYEVSYAYDGMTIEIDPSATTITLDGHVSSDSCTSILAGTAMKEPTI